MIIPILDYTSGFLVLFCIYKKFKYKWVWGLYSYGCLVYAVLNFVKGLYGQGIMNIAAAGIAAWNIVSEKKGKGS
jgi:hypothetical protein